LTNPAGQIVSVPRAQALATKMMFWAWARVSFRATKIVSCNNIKKIHGLQSKLLQLFYFSWATFCQTLSLSPEQSTLERGHFFEAVT
jgi:hypothetical protein